MKRLLKFLSVFFFLVAPLGAQEKQSSIGYPSVEAAFEALKRDPTAEVRAQGGWTIVGQKKGDNFILWSFTPVSHPAHPAVVKQTVFEKDSRINIQMDALCQAKKAPCDKLVEEFKVLTEKMGKRIQRNRQQ